MKLGGALFLAWATLLYATAGSAAQEGQAVNNSGAIEEVVVTAQKREERLQDVPLAVSAFTAEFLEDRMISDLMDLTRYAPSMRFEEGGAIRSAGIAVRGIGSGGGFNAGVDGSVGMYLDGVYIPKQAGLLQSLTDITAIELLKGPQGTLYGANTPAGVLNVRTGRPTQEFEANVQIGVGNFDSNEVSGYVSGGLSDQVAGRFSFWSRENGGWLDLMQGGTSNSREEYGGRMKLLWAPSDRVELELAMDYSQLKSVCCDGEWIDISDEALATFDRMATGLNLDRDKVFPSRAGGYLGRGEKLNHKSFSQAQGAEQFEHWGVSLRGSADLGGAFEGFDLTAILSYRDWDSDQAQDQDEVGVDISLFAEQPEIRETTTFELRLSSPADRFLEYTAGLFYLNDDGSFQQQSQLTLPGCMFTRNVQGRVDRGALDDTLEARSRCGGHGRSDNWEQEWESIAAFVQATANLTDNLSLTLGGRITRDDKSVEKTIRNFDALSETIVADFGLSCPECTFGTGSGTINELGILFGSAAFEEDIDNTEVTWAATLQYYIQGIEAADDLMVYARAATGYKAPGINARPIRFPTIPRSYDEETSENYEIGVKSTWWDRRLQVNLAVYQNNFKDLQQTASNPSSDPTGASGTFVQNAGELEHTGAEIEYILQPTSWLSLSGGIAYLDSEYVEFFGAPCPDLGNVPADPINPALCDFTGLPNVETPEWRSNQTVRLTFPGPDERMEWFVQGSWIYTDDLYVSSDLDLRSFQDSYSTYDMSTGVQAIDGRWKVTAWVRNLSDEIYVQSISNGAVPALVGVRGSKVARLGMPRSFGLRASMNF
jgi:iron complex outermembrane receptor protein